MGTSCWGSAVIGALACACAIVGGGAIAGCGATSGPAGGRAGGANTRGTRASGGEEGPRCAVPHAPGEAEFEGAMAAARDGDLARSRRLFTQSCDIGNPCACTELGESFVDPPPGGGARDAQRGALLLERGCEGGDVWGCYALGSAIWRFLPERVDHAHDLWADACEDGVAEACAELGRLRATGIDGDAAPRDALPLYDRACREGVHYACVMLGQAYAEGIGTSRDPARAAELLTWACDEVGFASACTAWADMLDVDDELRAGLLSRACDGGDREACDEMDPDAPRMGGEAALAAIGQGAPEARLVRGGERELAARVGGEVDLSTLGLRPSCVGFVAAQPSAVLRVPEGATELRVRVRAPTDTVLAIRDPAGRWTCADDGAAGVYDPTVEVDDPAPGDYLVWAGTITPTTLDGHLVIAADAPTPPPPPPVTYESLPEPSAESASLPSRRLRFYQLQMAAMPGLVGRVLVDGEELLTFGERGASSTSDRVQCLLDDAGAHAIEVQVTQRARGARVLGGEGGLVQLALYGSDRRFSPSDATRLFQVDWSPDAPSRHRVRFDVSRRQTADRTAACRE